MTFSGLAFPVSASDRLHCISFHATTIALISAPRRVTVTAADHRSSPRVLTSAAADFVHVALLSASVLICTLSDGRVVRAALPPDAKRALDADSAVWAIDAFPVLFAARMAVARVLPVDEATWLLQDDAGATQRLVRLTDAMGSSVVELVHPPLGDARLAFLRVCDEWVAVLHDDRSRVRMGELVLIDLLGEPVVHVDVIRRDGRPCVLAVGAFGSLGFAVLDGASATRSCRWHSGVPRCAAPCAASDDGELLLVSDGERLVAVSLHAALALTDSQTCAPTRALPRSLPLAVALRRTPLAGDEFVGVALLANGTIATIPREFLMVGAFPPAPAAAFDARTLQRTLAELDAVVAQEAAWRARDAELSAALRDMAGALRLDRSAVQCRLQPSMGVFSVFDERALIGVHVTYAGAARLSERWSLSVRSRVVEPAHASGAQTSVVDVPVHQLPPSTGSSSTWTLVVGVPFDVAASLDVSVALVFAALDGDDGWCLSLVDGQRFDALDFCKLTPAPRDEPTLAHSCAIALHTDWHALLGTAAADERAAQLLATLVPAAGKRAAAHLSLVNGQLVRLRVAQSDDFQLSVSAECGAAPTLAVLRTCLQRRIAALRRSSEHAAVSAKLQHYALAGGGRSATEAAMSVARAAKTCLDRVTALQDDADALIAARRAHDASRRSVDEQARVRDAIEQASMQLRATVNRTIAQ